MFFSDMCHELISTHMNSYELITTDSHVVTFEQSYSYQCDRI